MAMLNNQRVYSAIATYQTWIDDDRCKLLGTLRNYHCILTGGVVKSYDFS